MGWDGMGMGWDLTPMGIGILPFPLVWVASIILCIPFLENPKRDDAFLLSSFSKMVITFGTGKSGSILSVSSELSGESSLKK